MNENIVKRNALLAQTVIKGLESRNMTGHYAENKAEALKLALSLIPEGSTVTMGGAMSAREIGLVDALKAGHYNFIDRDEMPDTRAAMLAAYDADVFLASANAMTRDGILVNIDCNANRVSAIAQGPRKVLLIVGMNKVCGDLDGAMKRVPQCGRAHQCPALRAVHALHNDRRLHGLQVSRHPLLSVPHHPLFPAQGPHPRDPGQRQSGVLILPARYGQCH